MKSTWRLLNEIINKRKSRNNEQSSFIIHNKEITDPMEIANHFCEFFTYIESIIYFFISLFFIW